MVTFFVREFACSNTTTDFAIGFASIDRCVLRPTTTTSWATSGI